MSDVKLNSSSNEDSLLKELPYFSNEFDPLKDETIEELLLNGHINRTYPEDGFIGFHSLKICSTNAKQMAKYLELSMGFEEVAYRGLETNSRRLASHVVRNGNILFEIINTLESVTEQYPTVPMSKEEALSIKLDYSADEAQILKSLKEKIAKLTAEIVDDNLDRYKYAMDIKVAKENLERSILNSTSFLGAIYTIKKSINECVETSKKAIQDNFESFMIQEFVKTHGEGVMDISFNVLDVDSAFQKAIESGAYIIKLPQTISDVHGSIKLATIAVPYTDIHHTLIQNINYSGPFLPNYTRSIIEKPETYLRQLESLPPIKLDCIDHCVENYSWNQMMAHARFYANIFGFHKYWSVDEKDVFTGETALKSIVMASSNGKVKMPINEPAKGRKKSQIEEFYDFNGGPGVQHIALKTNDIIATVSSLRKRGIEFNPASQKYYDTLKQRLINDDIILKEDFNTIENLNILVDYDPETRNKSSRTCNYILQIFTKPLHDRPTLFIEIIQRHHHNGFGKGTFKGLFETIEAQQKLRGTLVSSDNTD